MVKDTPGNTSMVCRYFGGSCNTLYYKKNVLEIILAYSVKYVYNLTFAAKERKKSAIMAQLSRETDFYYSPKVVAYGGFDLFLSNPPTLP